MPPDPRDPRRPLTGGGRPLSREGVPREQHEGHISGVWDNPLEEIAARTRTTSRNVADTQTRLNELAGDIGTIARHVLNMEGKVQEIDERMEASAEKLDEVHDYVVEERESKEARKEAAEEARIEARQRRRDREEREAREKLEERRLRAADRKHNITLAGMIITAVIGLAGLIITGVRGTPVVAAHPTVAPVPMPMPVPTPLPAHTGGHP